MADLTPEARARMAARVVAAPNTPWRACDARDGACDCGLVWAAPGSATICVVMGAEAAEQEGVVWRPGAKQAAMRLIAHAPADLAALLAHADAQDAEGAKRTALLDLARDGFRTILASYRKRWPDHGAGSQGPPAWAIGFALVAESSLLALGSPDRIDRAAIAEALDALESERPSPHAPDCWRYHHACAVARLEAVAEAVARVRKLAATMRHQQAETSGQAADVWSANANGYEHAADLLGKAMGE